MKIVFYAPNSLLPPGTNSDQGDKFRGWVMRQLRTKYNGADITVSCVPRYLKQTTPSYYVEGGNGVIEENVAQYLNGLWARFISGEPAPTRAKCVYCGKWSDQ